MMEKINEWNVKKNYYSYTSLISVKIGNLVKVVQFQCLIETELITNNSNEVFKDLVDAGFVLKPELLTKEFKHEVEVYRIKHDKQELEEATEKFNTSWIFGVEDIVTELNKKLDKKVTFKLQSLEQYLKNQNSFWVRLFYKGFETNLSIGWNNKYEFNDSHYNMRKSAKLKTIISMFYKFVDKEFIVAEQKQVAKTQKEAKQENLRKSYQNELGVNVKVEIKSRFREYGPREQRHYTVTLYNIILNKQNVSVSECNGLWNIGSFRKLPIEQAKKLIAIF